MRVTEGEIRSGQWSLPLSRICETSPSSEGDKGWELTPLLWSLPFLLLSCPLPVWLSLAGAVSFRAGYGGCAGKAGDASAGEAALEKGLCFGSVYTAVFRGFDACGVDHPAPGDSGVGKTGRGAAADAAESVAKGR